MNPDPNPYVFPVCHNGHQTVTQGIRLRDWLAGQAIGCVPLRAWDFINDDTQKIAAWAKLSYQVADAMLLERAKTSDQPPTAP